MVHFAHIGTFARMSGADAAGSIDSVLMQTSAGPVLFALTVTEEVEVSAYRVAANGRLSLIDSQILPFDPDFSPEPRLTVIEGRSGAMLQVSGLGKVGLMQIVLDGTGQMGAVSSAGAISSLGHSVQIAVGGAAGLCSLDPVAGTLQVWSMRDSGAFNRALSNGNGADAGGTLTDIAAMSRPDGDLVLALSTEANALIAYKVQSSGALTQTDRLDPETNLWIADPVAVETIRVGGQDFALVAAAGSATLSVVHLAESGKMTITDHLMDGLDTRFALAQVIEAIEHDGRGFIVAAGADDGISLFELLPNGQLLLLGTLANQTDTTLNNIASLSLSMVNGQLDIMVGSNTETGLTVLRVAIPDQALRRIDDGGDDAWVGGSGNDLFIDAAGSDSYTGGAGADIFVFGATGGSNVIRDFDVAQDRFDISHWTFLRSLDQLSYTIRYNGAEISFGDESLRFISSTGAPITRDALMGATTLAGTRILPSWSFPENEPEPEPVQPLTLIGTSGDDILTGDIMGDLISGEGGDDTISGLAGDDTLYGGDGDDTIKGNAGNDFVGGGAGNDTLSGGIGWDEMNGGHNDDTMRGDDGFDVMEGGRGNDRMWGNNGNDTIRGDDGNDVILGGLGADRLSGGAGNDTLRGESGGDWLSGGPGNDTVAGNAGFDTLYGDDGDDILSGGLSPDTIYGGTGADQITGDNGGDTLYGGEGDDVMSGNAGADTLFGEEGDDILSGGINNDLLYGGDGHDVLSGDNGADTVHGDAGNDVMSGNSGNDQLFGGSGNDRINGGTGNDILTGGSGADVFLFNQGADWITDYEQGVDALALQVGLWRGGPLTLTELRSFQTAATSGEVELDFGAGNTLRITGAASVDALYADLSWF